MAPSGLGDFEAKSPPGNTHSISVFTVSAHAIDKPSVLLIGRLHLYPRLHGDCHGRAKVGAGGNGYASPVAHERVSMFAFHDVRVDDLSSMTVSAIIVSNGKVFRLFK